MKFTLNVNIIMMLIKLIKINLRDEIYFKSQ